MRNQKKILEDLSDHFAATIMGLPPPDEWIEFKLCATLHCMPEELDGLPEWKYQLWRLFLPEYEQIRRTGTI